MKRSTDYNYNFLLTGAATNVGQVRKANEDSMAVFEAANMKIFVVCDGMGGHVGGQVASQTAAAAIRDFLVNNITLDPREAIHNSIIAANEAILRKAAQQPELAGMGSTCVMLVVTSDGKAYYGHVGDSRIYIVANHHITQITKDHSFVQSLVDAGQITKEQAERHPRKNEITNALGLPSMQPPAICSAPIEPDSGNCFLLCSDGLTGMVGDEQIQRVISKHEIPVQQRAEKLVEMANANGGVDNITVELVEYALGAQQVSGGGKKTVTRKELLLYVLPALVGLILGGLAWSFFLQSPMPMPDNAVVAPDTVIIIKTDTVYEVIEKKIQNLQPAIVPKDIVIQKICEAAIDKSSNELTAKLTFNEKDNVDIATFVFPRIQNLFCDKEGNNTIIFKFLDNKVQNEPVIITGKTKSGKPVKVEVSVKPPKVDSETENKGQPEEKLQEPPTDSVQNSK
ncbi:MAG: Stp1/IreP family PP2C-type Ser/Thr phosphatase [Prevotellaceae bacterium]|jgi:protein phosphatase|nr:Stp1/IreP family PP2C-type Ser/Thr phosphatase [Prevotellaceae bacterium]